MRSRVSIAGLATVSAAIMVAVPAALGSGSSSGGRAASFQAPLLSWSLGRGDHYEVQFAADSRFNSPALGRQGHFTTKNSRATLTSTIPDGKYWWRVRSVSSNGHVSSWVVRSFAKSWRTRPTLVAPKSGATIAYPTQPLLLSWKAIPGAARYSVAIARDASFTALVGGKETVTSATSFDPPATLALGTYYWRVTPLDAGDHRGAASAVRSFRWVWPTRMILRVNDLVDAPELFEPQLSWSPVAGAAKYEVDVNFSEDFSAGSRVCCSKPTITTAYSPTRVLPNNTYFWRIRPIDPHGNEGPWTVGASFVKTFDTVPPVADTSIKRLRVRSNTNDPGSAVAGFSTSSPIVVWDPVPGASAYELNLGAASGGGCSWQSKVYTTAMNAWTPLAQRVGSKPYPGGPRASSDPGLAAGSYCVRVRALNGGGRTRVFGDFAYLPNAFTFTGYPSEGSPRQTGAGDYVSPGGGSTNGWTPLLTWQAIPGAGSYWVIVSRDQSFTTLVDYALTQIPAYAPRKTYADETTSYYWAVIPAGKSNGSSPAAGDPHQVAPQSFQKRSTPASLLTPSPGKVVGAEQPVFHWSAVQGARTYRLQVSTDPQFASSMLDNVETDSTAYASETTYPAGKKLYWRVQASDENGIDLTWSSTGTFEHRLPAPSLAGSNVRAGDSIPVWRWRPVAGALEYDLKVTSPDGKTHEFSGIPTPAAVPDSMGGLGVFHWQVRAVFPRSSGSTEGPYSRSLTYARTIHPPSGMRAAAGGGLVLSWQPRLGADSYRVEVAHKPDFSDRVDSTTTEGTVYAPTLGRGYDAGGTFYWHVATRDADGNTGSYSKTQTFRLAARKK